jgi:parvulin-like peptidyl-prolyl isomerase
MAHLSLRISVLLGALTGVSIGLGACGAPPAPAHSPAPNAGAEASASVSSASVDSHEPKAIKLDTAAVGLATPISPPPPAAASASPATIEAAAAAAKPSRITARHVLIQYMGAQSAGVNIVRTKEQAYEVAKEVLRRAKAGEDFARLALDYSDEPNAGARGGSLGRFGHGQMVHQFEDAAFALKVGEISGIVETPFGYHVILRTE